MPPLPSHWLKSPPADRLRVGECVVDVPLREIVRADGSKTRVTLKSVAVLLVLAENAGRVVTRDALLESVWAGTMPTIDVVTQAIASLRKALGGDGEATAYVETIPKTGYRLLAAVEWLPGAAMMPRGSRWRVAAMIAAGAVLLATLGWSIAGWPELRGQDPTQPVAAAAATGEVGYTLLTSRPGREVDPALSPDGASVAYAMPQDTAEQGSAIFVQSTQPTPARQLTVPPPGHADRQPRWSPDGRQLMFVRTDDKDGCELRLLPATGGVDRVVGSCDRFSGGRYDWLPDGSGIVAGLRPEGSGQPAPLSILRLDTGLWQPMAYPIVPGNVDFDPRFSPDGSRLAFRRDLSRSDIWVMPAWGGTPQRVTRLRSNITGWDWSPDARSLLLGLNNGITRLVRHDLASGADHALGRLPAIALDVAARGNKMVFAIDDARIGLFRYRLPLRRTPVAQPLFPSTGTEALPSPSPDGSMVAFHSNRSRETRLWIGEPGNPDRLRMIEGLVPINRHPAQWSADGRTLLVVGEPPEPAANAGPVLYEVDVASARASPVTVDGVPYFAQYLPGRRMLAVVDLGSGKWSLRILDRAPPGRVLAQLDDIGEARFDPASGQVYFARIDSPGLWRAGADLDAPTLVDGESPAVYWVRSWALVEGEPVELGPASAGCLAPWRPMAAASAQASGCLDPTHRAVAGLALVPSRDGEWLYASMVAGLPNTDIGVLDLGPLTGESAATH